MKRVQKILLRVTGGLIALAGIGWLGLQVRPANFSPPTVEPQEQGTITLPPDLPAPVRRYMEAVFGEEIPRMTSMVALGRARANFGIWMPLRYRLTHWPGYAFEREMVVTWFGYPILRALDQYLDGKGMTGPVGHFATGPTVDQGANMILWAEAPLMPSLWLTDERISWEPIDATSARLFFPFETESGQTETDEITVYFDEESGLITRTWALRYRDVGGAKIPWRVDYSGWQEQQGVLVPTRVAVTWEDQGSPWSYWDIEYVVWNIDISETLPQPVGTGAIENPS